jgi:hypothetical protein
LTFNALGNILGDFFTNLSGHPVPRADFQIFLFYVPTYMYYLPCFSAARLGTTFHLRISALIDMYDLEFLIFLATGFAECLAGRVTR